MGSGINKGLGLLWYTTEESGLLCTAVHGRLLGSTGLCVPKQPQSQCWKACTVPTVHSGIFIDVLPKCAEAVSELISAEL